MIFPFGSSGGDQKILTRVGSDEFETLIFLGEFKNEEVERVGQMLRERADKNITENK